MKKIFVPYKTVRNNALKLAYKIYTDGFIPDVIYVSLRGGAYIGNVISEYFKIIRKDRHPVFYAAVVARSYEDVSTRVNVRIDGWTYNPEHLRNGDKVMLVDDIYDSGYTINHLAEILLEKGIPREDIKVIVHDYKERTYLKEQLPIQPDYSCIHHIINSKDEDFWIHYMSHELVGLTEEERKKYYLDDDNTLKDSLMSF
jgi:uncharacterized protein